MIVLLYFVLPITMAALFSVALYRLFEKEASVSN